MPLRRFMPFRRENGSPVYPLDSVLDFLRLLWSVEHGLQRTSKRMEATLGITGPQRFVLRIVGRFPGMSAGELAHIVQLHPSTITGILQRLVSRRFLVRDRDAADGRRIQLRLTRRARGFTRGSGGTVERAVVRALARVSERHLRGAREVLVALAESLDESSETAGERRAGRRRRTSRAVVARRRSR
jgi:DNA-binding MarR family transcriptional regulator